MRIWETNLSSLEEDMSYAYQLIRPFHQDHLRDRAFERSFVIEEKGFVIEHRDLSEEKGIIIE